MKFVHLTDLHVVPPGNTLYGLDPNDRLRAAVADINAHRLDAEFVLITGDLAHDGDQAAYQALKQTLSRLPLPKFLLIGNHDDRAKFRTAFPETSVDKNGFVQSVIATPAGSFVLLDTHQPGTHEGMLCELRLAWLDRTLSALRGKDVFLAMHHPPLLLDLPAMDAIGLASRRELAEIVARYGNVRHVFFGHVHRPVNGSWNGIPFSTHRGLNHQVALHVNCRPGRLPGSHEPPAYAIVSIENGSVIVHVHDFLDSSPCFDLFDRQAELGASPSVRAETSADRQ